jgi:phage protein D
MLGPTHDKTLEYQLLAVSKQASNQEKWMSERRKAFEDVRNILKGRPDIKKTDYIKYFAFTVFALSKVKYRGITTIDNAISMFSSPAYGCDADVLRAIAQKLGLTPSVTPPGQVGAGGPTGV